MSRPSPAPSPSPSPLRLACVLLALATPALASREEMLRNLNNADYSHSQLVFGSGRAAGCKTFQLSFTESCCPSSYTRVKSTSAHGGHHDRSPSSHNLAGRRRKAAPTLDPVSGNSSPRRHTPSLAKRRLAVDWLAPVHYLDHLIHPDSDAQSDDLVPPPSPTRTASSTAQPQPNPARDATYSPSVTAAPVADPGQVGAYAVDDSGCLVETVYRQATCPSPEERTLEESRQILQLEMWKEEGGGKRVVVECGRVGTFWY